ncbi:hypothetical protein [Sagittula sp. S175]|uniref:hypothetical protein n=1 Tax=Sagittula sp. S175 TaxID=3415129 RepID=UPI003C7DF8D5
MFDKIKLVGIIAVIGFVAYGAIFGDSGEQTADLGEVLDRTEFALVNYDGYLTENNVTEVTEENIAQFTGYLTEIYNSEPRFYDQALGLEIQTDAKFLGYADANANGVRDTGEGDVFTVEIDEENRRLIATDMAGHSSGLRFSGTGFLAGAFIGSMLARQRNAGITAASFNNRNPTPRSSYKAPSSARSGGLRAGK